MDRARARKLRPRDWGFLALFALVVAVGVRTLLAVQQRPSPVAYDDSVLAEENPQIGDVRALTQLVRQRFAYLEFRRASDGLDLEALEGAALAELLTVDGSAAEEGSFRRAMRRYVSALRDGHAFVQFEEVRLLSDRHWPFTALPVAEGVMVDGVHPDVEGRIERGDLVRSVNGVAIEVRIAEAAREVTASTDAARRRLALDRMTDWSRETELVLELERAGARQEVAVTCPLRRLEIDRPGRLPVSREWWVADGGIAYLRPGDFAAPEESGFRSASPEARLELLAGSFDELGRAFEEVAGAQALILDLRNNPGGTDLLGQALVAYLLEPGQTYYSLSSRLRGGWSDPSPVAFASERPAHGFDGEVVCLIDGGTFSVADNVAACLRDLHPRVTFVGENTGAGTGAPRTFTLPRTGTRVTFCTMRVYAPSGRRIEGEGVAPDRPVLRTREDVLAGRDTVLETALELLR